MDSNAISLFSIHQLTRWLRSTGRSLWLNFQFLHSLQAMMGNLICIGFLALIGYLTQFSWLLPGLQQNRKIILMFLGALAVLQLIRAARKSMLLPFLGMLVSGVAILALHFKVTALPISINGWQQYFSIFTLGMVYSLYHAR